MQIGVDFLDSRELQAYGDRYFISYHSIYPRYASSNNLSIAENIRQYDEIYKNSLFTRTKAPGLMVVYLSIERLFNGNPLTQQMSIEFRLQRLRSVIVFGFPILSSIMVFLLYLFSRKYLNLDKFGSILTSTALVLTPNFILLAIYADQAIYPLLFLLGISATIWSVNRQSYILMFLLGIILYGFSFISFPLLSLFPLAGIYLFIRWIRNPKETRISRQILLGLIFLLGVSTAFIFFLKVFDYDFVTRLSSAMEIHRGFDFYTRIGEEVPTSPEPLFIRFIRVVKAFGFNNLDFAAAVGFPMFILFITHGVRLIAKAIKRTGDSTDLILLSIFLTYLVSNLGGGTLGEVGRLWLFWTPVIVIFAINELRSWNINKVVLFSSVVVTQLVTLLLTFHFQDLLMSN